MSRAQGLSAQLEIDRNAASLFCPLSGPPWRLMKTIRGKVQYLSHHAERFGQERGREHFHISVFDDGRRTLSAHCEIDDAPAVMRDVTYSVGPGFAPLDCFVRLNVGGEFMGSGWFKFSPTCAEGECFNRVEGRISQRLELSAPIAGLGAHPIMGDAWLLNVYDLARGPGRQFFPNMMLTSPDHRGATGPLLFRLGFGLEFVGHERISVIAGSFDALHFRYVDTAAGGLPQEHPPYDVWCTDDGDYVYLKGQVGGSMQTIYELIELKRS